MKRLYYPLVLVLSLFYISSLDAQIHAVESDGDPITLTNIDLSASPSSMSDVFQIAAGDEIEGDFHISPCFEPEGAECWVLHRTTNNISVVDVSQGTLVRVIETGLSPMDVDFTDSYAIVACYGSDEVQIWDWRTDTLVTTIEVYGQPARVEVSEDESTAVVSLELPNEALVINLEDFSTQLVTGFPTGISGFSFITSNTRNTITFNGFAVSPDGSVLVNGTNGPLKFYDLTSGQVDSIPEIENAVRVKYTPDGSKLVAVVFGSAPGVYQVDPQQKSIIKQIFPDDNVNAFNGELAMTPDGERVLLPATNAGWLIRFDMDDFLPITTTSAVFWTDITEDGTRGIAGGFNAHSIDMESGNIIGTATGISLNHGAISPSGDFMLAMDPLRRERAELFFTTTGVFNAGHVQLGSELEADATYSTRFTSDGSKVVCVNSLSGTVSVIDASGRSLDGIIALDNYEVYHAALSPDDRYAYIGERLVDQVSVLDLQNMEIVKSLYSGGDRPDQTFVHPSGSKVYALNAGGADAIGVIETNGADATYRKSFPSGNTGISWTNRGIRCNLAMTQDGSRGVLATPFDDQIQIIDLENDAILESIPTEGFPLQTSLSHAIEGRIYAAVTLKNSSEVYIIEDILGDPVGFGAIAVGGNPTRIDFDPTTNRFAVCSNDDKQVHYIDPLDFRVVETQRFADYLTPISIRYSDSGREFIVLQSGDSNRPSLMKVDSEVFEIGIAPAHDFDVSPNGEMAAVASLHEDAVYLIDLSMTSTRGVHRIANDVYRMFPNPASDVVKVSALTDSQRADQLRILDQQGRKVSSVKVSSGEVEVNVAELPSGAYEVIFLRGKTIIQRSRLLKQ